jgi:hypothetical protein
LSTAGLVKSVGHGWWEITEEGQRLLSATGPKPITRGTAEQAVREFLTRVERVNGILGFLGRIHCVVLFESMLREQVDRLIDVDLAIDVLPKRASNSRC